MKRYSSRPFPPYRHLPGTTPHPERSPEGHMYRAVEPAATPLSQLPAAENDDFRFGVDLFNAGYYWEAHTFWERLWAVENEPELRRFLQSIIQTAAACLKVCHGQKAGARKLVEKARLEAFEGLIDEVDALKVARDARRFVKRGGEPPRIILDSGREPDVT